MNNFRIPPSAAWFVPATCTPNNGLLYIAGNKSSIAYIPPIDQAQSVVRRKLSDADQNAPNVEIIQLTQNRFKSIACDPNWTKTKWFITLNEDNVVWVWNLETQKVCRGHKAHVQAASSTGSGNEKAEHGGVMCITKNRQVLSMDRNAIVKYCIASNTYSLLPDNFITKRQTVCILKASPYNENLVGVGYRNGLILIADIAESKILQKLRAHDTDIVSMEWMLVTSTANAAAEKPIEKQEVVQNDTPKKVPLKEKCEQPSSARKTVKARGKEVKQTNREPPKPIVDFDDMFDMHTYDYLEEEFGTISQPAKSQKESKDIEAPKPTATNANFDFAEACQSLRDQIKKANQSESEDDSDDGNSACDKLAVNMSDIREMVEKNGPIADDSIVISDDDEEDGAGKDIANMSELKDLEEVINALDINEKDENIPPGKMYLASGAQESFVVIWNVETGTIADKIQLKSHHGKLPIPKPVCAVSWFRPNELLVNSPSGKVSAWKTNSNADGEIEKFAESQEVFSDTAVIGVCSNKDFNIENPIVWTFSMHLHLVGRRFVNDTSEVVAKYSTLPIGMYTIRECPHDQNKIAIAGNNKRINILDLSTLKVDNIQIQSLTSKIQDKVLAVAWHPTNENLLAFSTNEGRVGVFNISKGPNPPDLMKNFNGKEIYRIGYGVDLNSTKCTLYACNDNKLMMFNESSIKFDNHKFIEFPASVSSVGVNNPLNYIAVGLSNGVLKILMNNQEQTEIYSESLAKKYISELAWSTVNFSKLAVGTNDDKIFILNESCDDPIRFENGLPLVRFDRCGELAGHQSGVTWVKWSNQSEHKLVSASFDRTVRVWNTQTMECTAWCEYENRMHCAIFLPSDENFVLAGGQAETMHMFDIRKRLVVNVGSPNSKRKKVTPFNPEVQWATQNQNDANKLRTQEKKKLRKMEKKNRSGEAVDEIADTLSSVSLSSAAPVKLNYTTILYLTNKELNKDPLVCLEQYLQREPATAGDDEDEDKKSAGFLHEKLFGERANVQDLLNEELKNHRSSKTESIGHLLIPQINYELKSDIVQSITEKRLTVQQISLAPNISFEFWKNCCSAYVNQCIEQGSVLQAIPYLMAIHQINDAIEKLCDEHFYREALCIAKLYKEAEDTKAFETITNKWIKHLEQTGNLEGAAFVAMLTKKPEAAIEMLKKRKNQTPQIEEIIKLIQQQTENGN